jgi:hypothetical protein
MTPEQRDPRVSSRPWQSIQVVGVYPVPEAPEPCHLIEVVVSDSRGFDVGDFVQPDPDQPEENWQTSWDERAMKPSGDSAITESFELSGRPELLEGDVRLVFFMHYLDPTRPLSTPFGTVELPEPTERPQRLSAIEYEEP